MIYRGYKILYDYHTHTVFSHGKGSIEDNVLNARKLGLKAVAISDHSVGHRAHGVKKSSLKKMRSEIDRLNEVYEDIDIYLSMEANFTQNGSKVDITLEELEVMDFLIAGFHYSARNCNAVRNFIHKNNKKEGSPSLRRLRMQNTDMVVEAIETNDIKIITHPVYGAPVHMDEVFKACEKRGTLLEINCKHDEIGVEDIKAAMKYDVGFVISSDAHASSKVGRLERGIDRAIEAGLDMTRIVNLEKA